MDASSAASQETPPVHGEDGLNDANSGETMDASSAASQEPPPNQGEDGLNNPNRFFNWYTEHAIAAFMQEDYHRFESMAVELLADSRLPLWPRCGLVYYMAKLQGDRGHYQARLP